jgi:hypothetical protein
VNEQAKKGRPPLPVDVRKVQHNMLWPPALLACIKAKASQLGVPVSTVVTEVMSEHFAQELQAKANTATCEHTLPMLHVKS